MNVEEILLGFMGGHALLDIWVIKSISRLGKNDSHRKKAQNLNTYS